MNIYLKTLLWIVISWLVVGLAMAFIGSGLTHGGFTSGEFVLAVIVGPALLVWLAVNIIIGLFGGTL